MQHINWKINDLLKKEIETHYRTTFPMRVQNKHSLEIIRTLTFDSVAPRLRVEDMYNFMEYVKISFLLRHKLQGIGLEVGAGCGAFSSVIAHIPEVHKVYGVEICEPIVRDLMPTVGRFVLGDDLHKLIGVVGEFDNLELEDSSVDFVFDFFHCIIQAIQENIR